MRIEKWGFLLSYAIYLCFCIIFAFSNKDVEAINAMIFAITIASTSFSIADLLFTKVDIDKKAREELLSLCNLNDYARAFYINEIKKKYGEKAESLVTELMDLFDNDEIDKFFENSLSVEEKNFFLRRVEENANDELIVFVKNFLKSDTSDITEVEKGKDEEKNVLEIIFLREKKEKVEYWIASIIAVMGLTALLIILTLRISAPSYISNALTILAFLSVIITLLIKEYYKSKSLKRIANEKDKVLSDLKEFGVGKIQQEK